MESVKRGLLLIINNKQFHDPVRYPYREGSDKDRDDLQNLFEKLGWIVDIENNMTKAVSV